jgi:uncharacterized SAM-binding protein YcdF (DUF218 family)
MAFKRIKMGFVIFTLFLGAYLSIEFFKFLNLCRVSTPSLNSNLEAIVVLTGDRRRIPKAVELLKERESELLIISGGGKGTSLVELLNSQGYSSENIQKVWNRIVLDSNSTTTIENAIETGKILDKYGFKKIILMTSEYHMPRALSVFRRIIKNVEYVAYPVSSDIFEFQFEHLFTMINKLSVEFWKYFIFEHFYWLLLFN